MNCGHTRSPMTLKRSSSYMLISDMCVCVHECVRSGRGTCRAAIDCPQGRMQNVNIHLRWGGTGGEGRDERMMGWTGGGMEG